MLDRWEDDKKMFEEQAPKESKEIIKKREDDFIKRLREMQKKAKEISVTHKKLKMLFN